MASIKTVLYAFNRGLISRLALARQDIKRVALSADTYFHNYMPRVMGSMMLRPGLGFLAGVLNYNKERMIPFVFSTSDTALLEVTADGIRVIIDDLVIQRVAVATTMNNVTTLIAVGLWTDADEAGATSGWNGTYGGLDLKGTGSAFAIRKQTVTVAAPAQNVEHGLHIVILRGPVRIRVGSADNYDDYITETELDTGSHSIAFTPSGDFYVKLFSSLSYTVTVSSIAIEAAGDVTLTSPWTTQAHLDGIRYDQSGDIIFAACSGVPPYQIMRRAARSWSCSKYMADRGPFRTPNIGPIELGVNAGGITGNITLDATQPLFNLSPSQLNGLIRLVSNGQVVTIGFTSAPEYSDPIELTGMVEDRVFAIYISGLTGTGNTIVLQRSIGEVGTWVDVSGKSWTADTTETFDDGMDNQVIFYRLKCSVYAGGTTTIFLKARTGSITGTVRINTVTDQTHVDVDVLEDLGSTAYTTEWTEGAWSAFRGYPSAVKFHEGRLCWAGKTQLWATVSDDYYNMDPDTVGDSGPISRTIGSGPIDTINWLMGLERLIIGAQGSEFVCKSNALDEPITPTNFNIKPASTQGSANVNPCEIDKVGVFVQRGGTRVMQIAMENGVNYQTTNLCQLIPEIAKVGIIRMAAQRQPDTRLHCVLSDGTVAVAIFDQVENVLCWVKVTTDGSVEDVVVLPGLDNHQEDQVYYVVARTINGGTVRYLEKWAEEVDCRGDLDHCYLADSYLHYSGAAATQITGLSSLEGKTVVVWADGADVGTDSNGNLIYTVSGGEINLSVAAEDVTVGLPSTALWQSAKLGYMPMPDGGIALGRMKNIRQLGLIAADLHPKGITYGPSFSVLDDLPQVEDGATLDPDTMRTAYDGDAFTFPGEWSTDSRLCLQSKFPRPATILGITVNMEVS